MRARGGALERLGDDPALANGVHPSFVEGRDAILFTGRDPRDPALERLSLLDLASGVVHDLGVDGSTPQYLSSGHLLWKREQRVWAAGFDLDRFRVVGEPRPVLDLETSDRVRPSFAASSNGTLVAADSLQLHVMQVAEDGERRPLAIAPGELSDPRLSFDGRLLAYSRGDQVWIHELATGRESRLAESRRVSHPVWTPKGEVVYVDTSSPRFVLRLATPGRGAEPRTLLESDQAVVPFSVSADGILLFTSGVLGQQIERLDLARPEHAEVWLKDGFFGPGMFSPDGRWVTYSRWSPESGIQVYLRSYPDPAGERPVSVGGGQSPKWAADGRTLYFKPWSEVRKGFSGLIAVDARVAGDDLDLGQPRAVPGITREGFDTDHDYDPRPDGRGFVVVEEGDEHRGFTVMLNLGRMLRERDRAAGVATQ